MESEIVQNYCKLASLEDDEMDEIDYDDGMCLFFDAVQRSIETNNELSDETSPQESTTIDAWSILCRSIGKQEWKSAVDQFRDPHLGTSLRTQQRKKQKASVPLPSNQRTLFDCRFTKAPRTPVAEVDLNDPIQIEESEAEEICGFDVCRLRAHATFLGQLLKCRNERTMNAETRNQSKMEYMRLNSVYLYFSLLLKHFDEGSKITRTVAAQMVAGSLSIISVCETYAPRLVRSWGFEFYQHGKLVAYQQGKHKKTDSLIDVEGVRESCIEYLINERQEKRSPFGLKTFIQNEVLPRFDGFGTTIHVNTCRIWMEEYLGFSKRSLIRKGIYTDGHERSDVVRDRQRFLRDMEAHQLLMSKFIESSRMRIVANEKIVEPIFYEEEPTLKNDEKKHVFIVQDECTFYANDGLKKGWLHEGEAPTFKPKSDGYSLMVSEFLCECHGPLFKINAEGQKEYARVIFHAGKDNYFNADKLLVQLQEKVVACFEHLHPDCVGVFAFDNSLVHLKSYMNVNLLNVNTGPNQKLSNVVEPITTKFICSNAETGESDIKEQPIVYWQNEKMIVKGLVDIVKERGLWVEDMKSRCRDAKKCKENSCCCAYRVLQQQPDFANRFSITEDYLHSSGHKTIRFPRYHCELNHIELFWGEAKRYCRRNCDYSKDSLMETLEKAFESIPLWKIQKFSRFCRKYMDAYRNGLTGEVLEASVKKRAQHRGPANQSIQLAIDPSMKVIHSSKNC